MMGDFVIFVTSLGFTTLGLAWSWAVYRRKGMASGMRGAAWALVPMAAYLTGVTEFVTDLVFSPMKWVGVMLAGLAVVFYMASGVMLRKKAPAVDESGKKSAKGSSNSRAVEPKKQQAPGVDPDLAEIEDILRNRGIS